MRESIIYTVSSIYRDDFRVRAYTFGRGEKALCVVGSMRGNEYQQLYIGTQLVKRLRTMEAQGLLRPEAEIMVIPSVNPTSLNVGKRFWPTDNTDINRMFPGYALGETTQRIAAGVFDVVNQYRSGIQLTSFYMPGDFSPHVRMMKTGYENVEKAQNFGLPYIVVRDPRPYDTTTLNYNWQIWETDAYSLYSTATDHVDPVSGEGLIESILRFMSREGLLAAQLPEEPSHSSRLVRYSDLHSVRTTQAGLYRPLAEANAHVMAGQPLGEVLHTGTGETLETLTAICDGVVFFQHNTPLVYAHTAAVKLLPDETA